MEVTALQGYSQCRTEGVWVLQLWAQQKNPPRMLSSASGCFLQRMLAAMDWGGPGWVETGAVGHSWQLPPCFSPFDMST